MMGRRVGASLALVTLLVLLNPHPLRGQASGVPPGSDADSWAAAGIWGVFVEGGSFGYDGSSQIPISPVLL